MTQRNLPYGLLGTRAELGPSHRRWAVNVYARNITNTDYITGAFGASPVALWSARSVSQGRHSVDNRPLSNPVEWWRSATSRAAPCNRTRGRSNANTDAVVPEVQQFILSSLPPSRAQKQLALVVLLGISGCRRASSPDRSRTCGRHLSGVLPIYVTTMIATDA